MRQNTMASWIKQLDGLLRGEITSVGALRSGSVQVSASGLAMVIQILGIIYGVCMGCYALFKSDGPSVIQLLATTLKVPALIFLTLVVTFPSLYVFNALVGSRLSLLSVLRLLIASLAVMMAVLASFGPIVAFFSASTTSYPFMLLLNVVVFTVSGFLGLRFLLFTLHRLSLALTEVQAKKPPTSTPAPTPQPVVASQPVAETAQPNQATQPTQPTPARPAPLPALPSAPTRTPGALDRVEDQAFGSNVKTIFRIWVVVFGLVGAQMSWVLRPFIGSPGMEFTFLRARDSNFFEAVGKALIQLLS